MDFCSCTDNNFVDRPTWAHLSEPRTRRQATLQWLNPTKSGKQFNLFVEVFCHKSCRVIKLPSSGGSKNANEMYGHFEGFPRIIVPYLGWNDPCFWGGKLFDAFFLLRGCHKSVQGTMLRTVRSEAQWIHVRHWFWINFRQNLRLPYLFPLVYMVV